MNQIFKDINIIFPLWENMPRECDYLIKYFSDNQNTALIRENFISMYFRLFLTNLQEQISNELNRSL